MNPVRWTSRSTDLFRKRYQLRVPDGGGIFSRPLLLGGMLSTDVERVVESPLHHVTPAHPLDYKRWTSKTMERCDSVDSGRRVQATSPFRRARDWVDGCPTCGPTGGSLMASNRVARPEIGTSVEPIPRRYGTAGFIVHGHV